MEDRGVKIVSIRLSHPDIAAVRQMARSVDRVVGGRRRETLSEVIRRLIREAR